MEIEYGYFIWNAEKENLNISKHQLNFTNACHVFADSKRLIIVDTKHSSSEIRYFCIGKINDDIITVRFTLRGNLIRIFGAGFWRAGKKLYEEKNKIHK
jgi:uncharacterized DUF497 family protein